MKFSEKWLREWVNPNNSTKELAEQLTMAGLEVDSVTPAAADFNNVVVGHIVNAEQHPNADRLKVCTVDVGDGDPRSIVCGGVNARTDLKVAVALEGAVLPGDFKIKKAKLRGVESRGMICSGSELGIDSHDPDGGIMELPWDAPIGEDFRAYYALNDYIIDIDLTPNRGDCASLQGIAREIGAINQLDVTPPEMKPLKPKSKETLSVDVSAPQACPRYVGRMITNIDNHAKTPLWMQQRLMHSGIRPIHPVVDVTNYVMLELGQPMHAFDRDKLVGNSIHVRMANPGEQLILLDGQTVTMDPKTLVIADQQGPIAMAGIMGGHDSAVSELTKNIFLESAFFAPRSVNARPYKLQTDSSYRFERGVDPMLQELAIERATALLLEIAGGEAGPLVDQTSDKALPQPAMISLRRDRIKQILGVELDDATVTEHLTRLGLHVKKHKAGWEALTPTYRFDLQVEIDLIEELARLYGYANIPQTLPKADVIARPMLEQEISTRKVCSFMLNKGYREVITYSFVDESLQARLNPGMPMVKLANPLSSDMAAMRTNLWPGLISALKYNQHRQQSALRLFEMGMVFQAHDEKIHQVRKLAGLIAGRALPEQWGADKRLADFYDIKGDIETLLGLTRRDDISFVPDTHAALHPGQSALIRMGDRDLGHVGVLHPGIVQHEKLHGPIVIFEIDCHVFDHRQLQTYASLSKFPQVRRDLALVVQRDIPVVSLLNKIKATLGNLLKTVQIFDNYQGEGISSAEKSVALGLIFQSQSRTLTDEEINGLMEQVIDGLTLDFNANVRE